MADYPATFIPGDYVMAQNYNKDDSKVYIRVKMTDSAYHAIEKYRHYSNRNYFTNGQSPKVQMDGNSGIIRIPTLANEESVNFGFSLDAVEGSMEAVQQTGEGLNILGPITHRMHANEDVFAETRTKMAMSEESERSKCTKVIKPNKSEIGRKMKKSIATLSGQHATHNQVNDKSRPELPAFGVTERSKGVPDVKSSKTDLVRPLSKPTNVDTRIDHKRHDSASLKSNSKSSHERNSTSNSLPSLPILKTPSKPLTNGNVISNKNIFAVEYKSSAQLTTPDFVRPLTKPTNVETNINRSRHDSASSSKNTGKEVKSMMSHRSTGAYGKSAQSKASGTKGGKGSTAKCNKHPDITRCKIKERVIQMLAVKPYKKLELYTRLQNEGLRDGERPVIGTVLREIALLRDNAYNLRRHIWNMVKEDWPFYSEEELQQMKENKPKDLTPPISSDTASPHSLNSPSPPPVASDSDLNYVHSLKRPGEVYHNPVPSKKQRISHLTTKERVGNHMSPTSENSFVYNGNDGAAECNEVINGTQITANSVTNESKSGKTSSSRLEQQSADSKSKKSSALISDKHPAERASRDKNSSEKNSARKSKKSSAPDSNKQLAEIVSVDKRSSSNKPKGSSRSEAVSTDTERQKKSAAPVSDQHPAEKASSEKTSNRKQTNAHKSKKSSESVSGKSKKSSASDSDKQSAEILGVDKRNNSNKPKSLSLKSKKYLDPDSDKQPAEIVSVDKRNSSNKPTSSSRNEPVRTDTEHKKKSAAPVSDQQSAEKAVSDKKSNRKTNAYKSRKSSESVSDKEGVSADRISSKYRASSSKGSRDSKANTNCIDTEKQQKSSRTEFSTNKETTRKSKCNNNADVPSSSATSIEARKQREQQSSQQQHTSQESVAHQSATSNALKAHKHAEQQSFRHVEPQQRVQQQFKSQEPVAQHSIITDAGSSDALSHFEFSSYTPITCVEQRRLYKAEFESDYEEYNQLFQSVEYVRRNFHILINQLKELPPDCPTYKHIQQQIVLEYERLDNVEERQRKHRFDYLQAKLAHITQLVNDYDDMLKAEAAAIEAAVRQHRLFQQQQQMLPISPIDEPEVLHSYAVNGSTQMLTTSAQPNNGHVSPMATDSEEEDEVAQPAQVSAHSIQQHTTNGVVRYQQAQQQNSVGISNRELASSSGAKLTSQQSQQQRNDHRNYQENSLDNSSDSSSEESNSNDESSSESEKSV